MPPTRFIVPIVAAVIAIVAWLIWGRSFENRYNSLVVPLGTFIGVFVLGQIVVGILQGMREGAAKAKGRPAPRNDRPRNP